MLSLYFSMEVGGLGDRSKFFYVVREGKGMTFVMHIQSYRHGSFDLFSIGT